MSKIYNYNITIEIGSFDTVGMFEIKRTDTEITNNKFSTDYILILTYNNGTIRRVKISDMTEACKELEKAKKLLPCYIY